MKKLALSLAIISALGLSACDSETIEDVKKEVADNGTAVTSLARVVFDPGAATPRLSIPNDLLFSGTQDGTLALPMEDPNDGSDPAVAMSALDGWSVSNPFVLNVDLPQDTTLDAVSVMNPASVRIFETLMGQDIGCEAVPRGAACKVVNELTFGVDFVAQASSKGIVIAPLKPLEGKTTYIVALTNNIQDSDGKAIAASITYDLVRQDITTKPLATESQLMLQGVINSYESAIVAAGADSDSLIYTMAMTTQSTTDSLNAIKGLMAANLARGQMPTIAITDTGMSAADILTGKIPDQLIPVYSAANYMTGSITLPYYLAIPSAENPLAPTNDWWKALCDSGAMLAGLAATNPAAIPVEPVPDSNDATCMAISQAQGLPAPGLRDLGIDTERNITKFNPVPAPRAMMPIDIQMTTPNLAIANAVRAGMANPLPPLVKPDAGWPIVILQHGLSGYKEQMLSVTGALSIYGIATVAIDAPLHGSRGFDLDGDGNDDINGSDTTLHYINLASLLTARDNFRQTIADTLGLRFGLNFMGAADVNGDPLDLMLDQSNVHYFGISLGGIMGISINAMANTELAPQVDGLFKINTASLSVPGLMLANFGMESPAFGSLVKSNLVYKSSDDFKAFVDMTFPNGFTQDQLTATYEAFYDSLSIEEQAELNGVFAQFTFAAQTVTDSGDPISYVTDLAATSTPIMLTEVIGNGSDNLPDQVVINTTPNTPMGGTEPAIALLNLPSISTTTYDAEIPVSGAVRYLFGHHGSVLTPMAIPGVAPDAEMTARATQQMQSQLVSFILSMGHQISVTDEAIVQ
ncbi:lipase [Colwellia sp. 75C3]|uniref:VolA/Pla-1 family phospholipase n=1 Tax=Colwellia sp. 75C3 TaxID=888425 RepID=UPI000C33E1C9|nr:VolA/Pla-1 family phospholipase [Colwellia sp. 75C3]PKG86419.1 lipase [Colwellia sp. 75C3]